MRLSVMTFAAILPQLAIGAALVAAPVLWFRYLKRNPHLLDPAEDEPGDNFAP